MDISRPERPHLRGNQPLLLILLTVAALVVRSLWVNWQPLWWDEGYSVYFATEPLMQMLWLTAHDIHPPLYYALLTAWFQAAGSLSPTIARLFSILIGALSVPLVWWLGRVFFPQRQRLAWAAAFLALISPFHLYYSQEIRMYGLAMALTLLSTGWFWLSIRRMTQGERAVGLLVCYAIASIGALHTLYYTALLLMAQALWAVWALRRRRAVLRPLLVTWLAVGLACLPWFLYAAPKLAGYIAQKVESDQDQPLGLVQYLWRHIATFTAGHVLSEPQVLVGLGFAGILGIALLSILAAQKAITDRRTGRSSVGALEPHESINAVGALWAFLLIPAACAFLLNLRLPFFPDGGERLLLFIWPYFFLLASLGIVTLGAGGVVAFFLLTISALAGVVTFYTTPRYVDHDYRPLIRQVVQQGADDDTLLAIFPWLIGYWRAYAPSTLNGPQPLLLSDAAIQYGPAVEAAVDAALAQGRVWFPEPLSFGSDLPGQIEEYLARKAINLENRWESDATRLSAWVRSDAPGVERIDADFGPVRLLAGGATHAPVASANDTILATLVWETDAPTDGLGVTLRLFDQEGRNVWASRDYAPLGSLGERLGNVITETVALNAPVGLAPGMYSLHVGVNDNGRPLTARLGDQSDQLFAPLGQVEITQPPTPQPSDRLPMAVRFAQPPLVDGVAWLGYTLPTEAVLAGTELPLTVFFQSQMASPSDRHLYVSLLNRNGEGVAGWEGWPLPLYPTSTWPDGALVQTPIRFFLPPTLTSGPYQVVGGWIDEPDGTKSAPVSLGEVEVEQRPAQFAPHTPEIRLDPAPLLGSHAALVGYDLAEAGEAITVTLHWDVQQPLLPPHHIFVHADDAAGVTLAQADGPPVTAAGEAPTGSWLPGEHLATTHRLTRPGDDDFVLRVGLYEPQTGVRLPVTVMGAAQGDAVVLAPIRH